MIRLATVGTSAITKDLVSAIDLENRVVHAVSYSRSLSTGEAFAKATGCGRVFTNLEQLARFDGIDAVYIASPNSLHASQSRLFIENGKHVLCEKPIASSEEEYRQLKKLADKNGVIYMEAIMPIYAKSRASIKQKITELGNICNARFDFCQLSSRYESFLKGEKPNVFNPQFYGGVLMDLGIYCVYAAVDLFGEPKSITAKASILPGGVDGSGSALLDYGGFQAVLTYSKTGQSFYGSEIIGDRGSIVIEKISEYTGVKIFKDGAATQIFGRPTKAQVMANEVSAFADFVEGGADALQRYESESELTLCVHRCMDKIRKSVGINFKI